MSRWGEVFVAGVTGVIFALGLTISGMTQPAKVVGFLDIFGDWDPSLAFVMGGAILVHAVAYLVRPRLARPWFAEGWSLPTRRDVDVRLVGGAALFGAGWGLAGLCPGPALVGLGTGAPYVLWFAVGMLGGMVLFSRLDGWWASRHVHGVTASSS